MTNVTLNPGFKQVCVWPGTLLSAEEVPEMVSWFSSELGTRIQFLETIVTAPDIKDGMTVEGTGGRSDVLFAVHSEDVGKFAIPRLQHGIRWIEDMYYNNNGHLYPERVAAYRSWQSAKVAE